MSGSQRGAFEIKFEQSKSGCAGGSRSAGASLLTRLHELALAEEELAGHSETLAAAEAQLKGLAAAAKEHAK